MTKFALSILGCVLLLAAVTQFPASLPSNAAASAPPETIQIVGTVLYEGQPLSEGKIVCYDTGSETICSTNIVDGRFELETTQGLKRLTITAWETVPSSTSSEVEQESTGLNGFNKQYLPNEFNAKTQLSVLAFGDRVEVTYLLESTGTHTKQQTQVPLVCWK